jgi:hypothetical protein
MFVGMNTRDEREFAGSVDLLVWSESPLPEMCAKIVVCPRCGGEHSVSLSEYEGAEPNDYAGPMGTNYWFSCPETDEPVIVLVELGCKQW